MFLSPATAGFFFFLNRLPSADASGLGYFREVRFADSGEKPFAHF